MWDAVVQAHGGRGNGAPPRPFVEVKESDMENRRTETARENDDSEIIERDLAEFQPHQSGSSGGNLQEDVATQAELERVRDPEAHQGVDKKDKINHAGEEPGDHIMGSSD